MSGPKSYDDFLGTKSSISCLFTLFTLFWFFRLAPKGTIKKMGSVQQTSFAAQNLEDLAMYDVDNSHACKECERKMVVMGHYNSYLCCTKCRYSSCCSKALSIHVAIFHGPEKPVFNLGIPSILKNEVFCVCGFSTNSGNKIGKNYHFHWKIGVWFFFTRKYFMRCRFWILWKVHFLTEIPKPFNSTGKFIQH